MHTQKTAAVKENKNKVKNKKYCISCKTNLMAHTSVGFSCFMRSVNVFFIFYHHPKPRKNKKKLSACSHLQNTSFCII